MREGGVVHETATVRFFGVDEVRGIVGRLRADRDADRLAVGAAGLERGECEVGASDGRVDRDGQRYDVKADKKRPSVLDVDVLVEYRCFFGHLAVGRLACDCRRHAHKGQAVCPKSPTRVHGAVTCVDICGRAGV